MPASELELENPYIEDRLLWDFSSKTYQKWFVEGTDDFHEPEMELRENYGKLDDKGTNEPHPGT